MKKLISLMLVMALLLSCLALAACGGDDDDDEDNGTQQTQVNGDEHEGDEADKDDDDGDDVFSQFADMDELDSYRMRIAMTGIEELPDGTTEEMTSVVEMAVVNKPAPRAQHMVMADPTGMTEGTMESIQIGDTTYTKFGDEGWMKSTMPSMTEDMYSGDITDDIDTDTDLDYKGKETVNGVRCKKYEVDVTTTTENPMTGQTIESRFVGEMWVADESGLPEVMIKQKGTSTTEGMGDAGISMMEMDITDINSDIEITAPPESEIMDMGGFGDDDMDDGDVTGGTGDTGDMEGMLDMLGAMTGFDGGMEEMLEMLGVESMDELENMSEEELLNKILEAMMMAPQS